MTRELVLRELYGRLWHTTHPDRFKTILKTGAILPEPNISDSERWKTSRGKDYYPYVRTLCSVSLFDFDQFEPDSYTKKFPVSSWYEFVPYRTDWACSVWIEIDREQVAGRIIAGTDLVSMWDSNNAHQHSIMPHIEAAHLGPLSSTAFKRAFLVREKDNELLFLAPGNQLLV